MDIEKASSDLLGGWRLVGCGFAGARLPRSPDELVEAASFGANPIEYRPVVGGAAVAGPLSQARFRHLQVLRLAVGQSYLLGDIAVEAIAFAQMRESA